MPEEKNEVNKGFRQFIKRMGDEVGNRTREIGKVVTNDMSKAVSAISSHTNEILGSSITGMFSDIKAITGSIFTTTKNIFGATFGINNSKEKKTEDRDEKKVNLLQRIADYFKREEKAGDRKIGKKKSPTMIAALLTLAGTAGLIIGTWLNKKITDFFGGVTLGDKIFDWLHGEKGKGGGLLDKINDWVKNNVIDIPIDPSKPIRIFGVPLVMPNWTMILGNQEMWIRNNILDIPTDPSKPIRIFGVPLIIPNWTMIWRNIDNWIRNNILDIPTDPSKPIRIFGMEMNLPSIDIKMPNWSQLFKDYIFDSGDGKTGMKIFGIIIKFPKIDFDFMTWVKEIPMNVFKWIKKLFGFSSPWDEPKDDPISFTNWVLRIPTAIFEWVKKLFGFDKEAKKEISNIQQMSMIINGLWTKFVAWLPLWITSPLTYLTNKLGIEGTNKETASEVLWTQVKTFITELPGKILGFLKEIPIISTIIGGIEMIKNTWKSAGTNEEGVKVSIFKQIGTFITSLPGAIIGWIKEIPIIKTILGGIESLFKSKEGTKEPNIFDSIKPNIDKLWNWIKLPFASIDLKITEAVNWFSKNFGDSIITTATDIFDEILSWADALWNWIKFPFIKIKNAIVKAVNWFLDKFKDPDKEVSLFDRITNSVTKLWERIIEWFDSVIPSPAAMIKSLMAEIRSMSIVKKLSHFPGFDWLKKEEKPSTPLPEITKPIETVNSMENTRMAASHDQAKRKAEEKRIKEKEEKKRSDETKELMRQTNITLVSSRGSGGQQVIKEIREITDESESGWLSATLNILF